MKEIKLSMVGIGNIGKVHCISALSIPLLYPNNDYQIRFGKLLRNNQSAPCPFYFEGYANNLEELCADDSTDAIDICSPNNMHFKQAMMVIESKKALYLEKPIGVNSKQAIELSKAVKDAGIISQTALMYRMMPGIIAIRDLIESGELGEIIDFKLITLHSGYLNVNRAKNWKLSKEESGGGPLLDIGVHMADTVNFTLGNIKKCSCQQKTVIKNRPDYKTGEMADVDVEDWANVRLVLENGITGSIEVSRVSSVLDQSSTFDVYGTKGSIHFSSATPNRIRIYKQDTGEEIERKAPAISDYAKYVSSIYPKLSRGWLIDSHTVLLVNFLNNLNANKILYKETPSFDDDANAQKAIEAAYESAENDSIFVEVK